MEVVVLIFSNFAVVEDLARVYHYYLHGRDGDKVLPDKEASDDEDADVDSGDDSAPSSASKKRKSSGSQKAVSAKKSKALSAPALTCVHDEENAKISISVFAVKGSKITFQTNLRDVSSVEVKLMHAQVRYE